MSRSVPWIAGLLAAALLPSAVAFAGSGWEILTTSPYVIRSRPRAGTQVRELWAEGDLDAPILDVQETILDCPGYVRFMPYVRSCRMLGPVAVDGSMLTYSLLAPPLIEPRDYVLRVNVDHLVGLDGTGEFMNRWVAEPDVLPEVRGAVRLRFDEGGWHAFVLNGRTHVVYRASADPGGALPPLLANLTSGSAIIDMFRAVEHEARRRALARGALR